MSKTLIVAIAALRNETGGVHFVNGKKSILIADADRALVKVIAMRCQFLGLQPIKAYDARTAFELILEYSPDIVCVDATMQANGMTICEVLSQDDDYSKIPAIVLTNEPASEKLARQCGDMCAYYVQKTANIQNSIEPVVFELVDLAPVSYP